MISIKSSRTIQGKVRRELTIIMVVVLTLLVLVGGTAWKYAMAADAGQQIADKAKELAWPEGASVGEYRSRPTDAFVQAARKINSGLNNSDCLSFVKTVVIDSGADTSFPSGGEKEVDLVRYMSSSDKWDQVNTTNESDLKPGDILVSAEKDVGRNHIFIYLGDGKVAGANLDNWYGRIGNLADEWDLGPGGTPFYYSGNPYKVFREKSVNNSSNSPSSSSSTARTSIGGQKSQLSQGMLDEFAQNNILFYDPSDCVEGDDGNTICSDDGTAEGIYWSVLSNYFDDPVKIAGVVGNLANEGGMNPVAWEGYPSSGNGGVNSSGELVGGWDAYYNGTIQLTGVGAFAITSDLNKYLHYVNENAPEYINYFKNTKDYSYNFLWHPGCNVDSNHPSYGDCLLEKIGETEFRKLVEFEVEYALGDNFNPTDTKSYMNKSFSTPAEAAVEWMDGWEKPRDRNPDERGRDAEKAYDKYKDFSCSVGGDCPKLAELRTKMWTEASQEDREHFMYIVSQEDYTIAGVEGYMNQVIAKYGSDGTLHNWIYGQCKEFTEGGFCAGDHTITNEDQDMINEALNGSNNIRFAVGNATGGSPVGAGKIVCVWDGTKCRDDVDYNAEGGMGVCSVYSPSADFGECWGLEGAEDWAKSMEQECSVATNTASSTSAVSGPSSSSSSTGTVSGNEIVWIGDSGSALAHDENGDRLVERSFPGVNYGPSFNDGSSYIRSCKFVKEENGCGINNPSGLTILRKIANSNGFRKYLVVDLGSNGGWSEEMMNEFLGIVNGRTNVIFVTPINANSRYAESNVILKKAAATHSNVYIADMTTSDKYSRDYYDEEGSEYTAKGSKVFIQTIKEALNRANSGSSRAATGASPSTGTISGSDITWIGDSYSTGAQEIIESEFSGISFGGTSNTSQSTIQDCKNVNSEGCLLGGNSTNPSGFDILRKIIQAGDLKPYLVFALGTNDGWDNSKAAEFNNIMSGHSDTEVVLVTLKTLGDDFAESNAVLKKMVDENANYHLADWTAVYKDSFFSSDNEHPYDNGGFEEWVRVIKEALDSAGATCSTGVEWDNGWIVPGTMEGLVIEDVTTGNVQLSESQVQPIGAYTTDGGKPNKILLHSTDGSTPGLAAYPSDNMYPAHFTIDIKNKSISQHFSIYQPSMAVGQYDKEGPIQFEIVGYSDTSEGGYKPEADLQNYSDEDWDYLAKVLLAIHEETGIPLTSSVDWAHGNNELSPEEFKNYEGVLGHMHTPNNEKIDPGDIWKFVSKAIDRQDCDDRCTTYEGEYPQYFQSDEPWGNMSYGPGDTYANSACGAASMAMLATVAAGQDIFPNDIGDYLEKQFALGKIPGAESPYYDEESVHNLDPVVGEHYGFEVITDTSSSVEETKTKFRQYLKDGYMIHFTGAGCYPGFQAGGDCSNGHVIGIFSIDENDNVMQANSAWGGNQESSLDDIANAKTWDEFTAIKGGSGMRSTCDNSDFCSAALGQNQNVAIGSNGLTKEEAQKVADYYNSNDVTSSNFIDGVIPSKCEKYNCVSFSYWFVSAFTDASEKGATSSNLLGNGSYIADTGLPGIGWQNGNDPKPLSVFGGAGSSAWSHTGVVVGTLEDGDVITIEAAYGEDENGNCNGENAQVLTRPVSYFAQGVGLLAYPDSHFTPEKGYLGNKSLYEIIGK